MPRNWIRTGIVIATLLLTLVLGFWARPVLTEEPVTISVLIQALEGAQMANLVESFNREHSDIRLELVEGPNASNLVEDLYSSAFLLGDSPYDLVYMDIVWVAKFAAAGWLLNLSDRINVIELAAFMPGDVAGGGAIKMAFTASPFAPMAVCSTTVPIYSSKQALTPPKPLLIS